MREGWARFASAFHAMNRSAENWLDRYLNGEFGPLEAIDPHLSALLYAGDRLEAKPEIEAALSSGKIVLADRYIGSNMAHQSERVPPDRREEFFAWLKRLEYGLYALPVEDLVIYLRVPVAEAHRLIGEKSARAYTSLKRDIQEADTAIPNKTALIYDPLRSGRTGYIDRINALEGWHSWLPAGAVCLRCLICFFDHRALRLRMRVPVAECAPIGEKSARAYQPETRYSRSGHEAPRTNCANLRPPGNRGELGAHRL